MAMSRNNAGKVILLTWLVFTPYYLWLFVSF